MLTTIILAGLRAIPVLIFMTILVGILYRQATLRLRWHAWAALAAGIALVAALVITLTPNDLGEEHIVFCEVAMPARLGLLQLPRINQSSLNALLLLPFGFFSALAAPKKWTAALAVVIVPLGIELTQALLPLLDRYCTVQDLVDNASGGLAGVVLGVMVQWVVRPAVMRKT
jgi:hypothetical protein